MKRLFLLGAAFLLVSGSLIAGRGGVSADSDQRAIRGRGTPNFIAKFSGPTLLGDSNIFEADGNIVMAEQTGSVGIGVLTPAAKLHVSGSLPGGGPTLSIENSNEAGDVAIDFLSNGNLVGNVGVIQGDDPIPTRFFVLLSNPLGLPLTLSEEGLGNVGIGTSNPQSALQVVGYTQLDVISGAPPGGDCDDDAERGRMKVDPSTALLYVCVNSGWVSK